MEKRKLRFGTARPLDMLASDFLAHLALSPDFAGYINNVYIDSGVDYAAKTAKVLNCTPRFWSWLGKARDEETEDTSAGEYAQKPPAEDWEAPLSNGRGTDGFSVQISIGATSTDPATRKIVWVPPENRSKMRFMRRFPADVASEFAAYDALIFVRSGPYALPPGFGEPMYRCVVCAHECYDLMADLGELLTGEPRQKWDPSGDTPDPALYHFNKFGETLQESVKWLYVSQPQADEIDL